MRVRFEKGKQKEFLDSVISNLSSGSLRNLLQFGFSTNYNCLKNYYLERRLIPKDLFDEICHIAKINKQELDIEYIDDNWGRIKGGKISKRKKSL